MKKILALLTILAIVAPSMAVELAGVDNADLTGTVGYDATDETMPRAFAFDITVDNGAVITAIDAAFTGEGAGFGIFPGTIEISAEGVVTAAGTPVAPQSDLPSDTLAGLGTGGVTVEMGSLHVAGAGPAATGNLFTVTVDKPCTVTITPNVSRGGIVLVDATKADFTSYSFEIAATGPECWGFARFGQGDSDGDGFIAFGDLQTLMAAWGGYNACADFDKDGFVAFGDLQILMANWGN